MDEDRIGDPPADLVERAGACQDLDDAEGKVGAQQRRVLVEGKTELRFALDHQDARGDGTVPHQSGAGPAGKIKQMFATEGYDHQGSFNNKHMLLLTLRLVTKIVQEIS